MTKNDKEMTKNKNMTQNDKKMKTQIQNDKPKCKKCKKIHNDYFGISNVCRPKIFLSLKCYVNGFGIYMTDPIVACNIINKYCWLEYDIYIYVNLRNDYNIGSPK